MSAMRDWLQHILSPMPWATAEWMDGALLGCTELFSNIVKHTQTAEPSNSHITLLVNQSDQACTFEWHFKKRPFNFDPDKPTQLPEPESLQESGYGMYLVDQLFEQLHYFTHCPEHQSIIAIKLLPAH